MLPLFIILISYLSSILITAQSYNFIGELWAYTLLPKMPHHTCRHTNIHTHAHTCTHTNTQTNAGIYAHHTHTHTHTLEYALAHKHTQMPMHNNTF